MKANHWSHKTESKLLMSFKLLQCMCQGTTEGANWAGKLYMILNWRANFNDLLDLTKHFPRDSIHFNKRLLKAVYI